VERIPPKDFRDRTKSLKPTYEELDNVVNKLVELEDDVLEGKELEDEMLDVDTIVAAEFEDVELLELVETTKLVVVVDDVVGCAEAG